VQRVIKQWVEEYKIDGFRWDLTKGFTQNCPANVTGGQENCTGSLQQDRIDVLKNMLIILEFRPKSLCYFRAFGW
jgi:1,4-alpha-glucan branching enzyme